MEEPKITKKIRLTFLTDTNKTHSITIDNPIENPTPQVIKDYIDDLINNEVIVTSKGKLVSCKEAKFITTQEEMIDLA